MPHNEKLSSIEEIIEDARNGRMYILVDDEDRENEGDLIIPAQMATPEAINFMARYGRGLICLSMTSDRVRELELPPMAAHNDERHSTAFTVSIEAREGVTTGISAGDRSRTVGVAIDPTTTRRDIVTPGHVFPLEARDGGVIVRAGHTEAAVDVSRLAGLNPSGVICEIMNEDGTMARLPDLFPFAEEHGLKIATIADLIAYRLQNDSLVEKTVETTFDSEFGGTFDMSVYTCLLHNAEHVVLSKGDVGNGEPVMVRMHALNLLDDLLAGTASAKSSELHRAMEMIGEEGRGAIVLLRDPSANRMSNQVRKTLGEEPVETGQLRDYGVGAQILLDLGIKNMILLSNTQHTIIGLEGYGLRVVEQRAINK